MTGTVAVKVKDSHNSYSFELKRNITVLCGESGRGKTTLYDMVHDYNYYGKSSGTKISCDKAVIAIGGSDWISQINNNKNSVIIIDEDSSFIRSEEFAHTVKNSSNYFLLITRCYLQQLPISVTEIYKLTGNKNKKFQPVYMSTQYMYGDSASKTFPYKPEVIITEDSGAGNQFFTAISDKNNIKCVSAGGKSNIYKVLLNNSEKKVLIIADGAAFGAEIGDIIKAEKLFSGKLKIFLPESFEWLILKSGIACNPNSEKISNPELFAESSIYFSWEQYFTDLLVFITKDAEYLRYPRNKSKLPEFYKQARAQQKVESLISCIDFGDGVVSEL